MLERVLILGGNGFVGVEVVKCFNKKFTVFSPSKKELDVTNPAQLENIIKKVKPDIIVNCVGFAYLEKSEDMSSTAFNLNATPSELLIPLLKNTSIYYYYLSTDAVFDGSEKVEPHSEDDSPVAESAYAKSKVKGEKATLKISNSCVIRITLPYSSSSEKKKDIVFNLLTNLRNNESFIGITDQFINPISLNDIVSGIEVLVSKKATGVYHIAASDCLSNFQFLEKVADVFLLDKSLIKKTSLKNFQNNKKAHRSKNCVLDVKKFNSHFYNLPTIEKSLQSFRKSFAF